MEIPKYSQLIMKDEIRIAKKLEKCIIEDNQIVCIVDEKKQKKLIRKINQLHSIYYLCLYDESKYYVSHSYSFIKKNYIFDKRINYIFDNIEFNGEVRINTLYNCNITFKNCTFKGNIIINSAGNIIFENNKYIATINDYSHKNLHSFYISTREQEDICSIKFVNDNVSVINEGIYNPLPDLKLFLYVQNLEFINSTLVTDNNTDSKCFIKTENLSIDNSTITSKNAEIIADKIESKNSKLNIENTIWINNKNCDINIIDDINAKNIIYNDEIITNEEPKEENITDNNKKTYIKKDILKEERMYLLYLLRYVCLEKDNLLNVLREIQNKCNNNNQEKLNNISTELNNKSISKILKK